MWEPTASIAQRYLEGVIVLRMRVAGETRPDKHEGAERLAYYGGPVGFGSALNDCHWQHVWFEGFSADVETFERA